MNTASPNNELVRLMKEAIASLEAALEAPRYVIKNPTVAGQIAAAVISATQMKGASSNGTAITR